MEIAQTLGRVVTATITDENDRDYFAQVNGVTYAIDKQETSEKRLKETIVGFIYQDTMGKNRMTTTLPTVRPNYYDWATVVSVRTDLGVFVDIGLPDKDVVVSLDDLPEDKTRWPKKGDRLYVTLAVDKKNRLWAKMAEERVIAEITKNVLKQGNFHNHEVSGRVYRVDHNGCHLITPFYHRAYIHESEWEVAPRLGEEVKGRVIGIGKNRQFNLSLQPLAYARIDGDAKMILANLKRNPTHTLPFNDHSDPEAIRDYFGISKAKFKRALGNLLKQRLIEQTETGIQLRDVTAE
ncbi:MAG: S1-like domain-containing RNA-binding protein [Aerococcus sp.]|nr:S1-like domain-containing RNA-binding protein [Aerococcus sp.]